MRNILFLCILLSICSCQQDRGSAIHCPNDISLHINPNEKVINKVGLYVEDFLPCVANIKQQCPLFRCIQADGYIAYVAMPLQLSLKDFSDSCRFKDMVCVDSIFSDSTVYKCWKSEDKEIVQFLYIKNKNRILIVGASSNHNDVSLTNRDLVERIQTKH